MNNKQGFTLIEILLVIIILAVLLLLFTPQLEAIYLEEQLRNCAILLHNDLRWAQMQAATEKERIEVDFQTNGYQVLRGKEEIRTVKLPLQVKISGSTNIVFVADYSPSRNGKVIISSGKKDYYVYYYQTGRIRLAKEANK